MHCTFRPSRRPRCGAGRADTLRAGVRFGVKGTRLDVLPDTVSAALDRMAVLIAEHAAAGGPLPEIVVCGVSSPEGSSGRNGRLASERAAYVLSCLREACLRRGVSLADSLVRVEIRASDWSGLRALVEASDDMKYRRQTMELLDTTPAEKRMDALWGLKWGVPYTYVQRYLLPRLRSASIVVSGGGAALGDDAGEAIAAAVRKIAAGDYAGALSLLEPWAGDPRAAAAACREPCADGRRGRCRAVCGRFGAMKTLWLRIAERVERAFYGERDHYVPGDDGMYVMKYIAPKQENLSRRSARKSRRKSYVNE